MTSTQLLLAGVANPLLPLPSPPYPVAQLLMQGSRYMIFVSDADEVVSPTLLLGFYRDRVKLYNSLNARGDGFSYLQMDTLVYGLRHKLDGSHSRSFLTTDRMIQAMDRAPGHLVTLTAIRDQVRAHHPRHTHALLVAAVVDHRTNRVVKSLYSAPWGGGGLCTVMYQWCPPHRSCHLP